MLNLVYRIGEKINSIEGFEALDPRPRLRKQNRIKSIHSSCSIEANSLSLGQVVDIVNGRKVVGPEKDILEVKNALGAYSRLGQFNPYELDDLLHLHSILAEGLVEDAGRFRTRGEGVFSGDRCIFVAPPPDIVPKNMRDLFDWLKRTEGELHPLIASCVFHYELVFIHPFADGNGRMARLWQTAILGKWKEIFFWIPIENRIEKAQSEYYAAIDLCNRQGNSDAFIEFLLQAILNALEDVEEDLKNSQFASPRISRLVELMSDGAWYSSSEIMTMLGVKSRSTFLSYYLKPALDGSYIEYEFPDSPRSRYQRYRITGR